MVTSLPALGGFASAAPMTLAELTEHVCDSPGPRKLVQTLFLADDLLLRQAILSGEIDQAQPSVLTAGQLSDEEPLPDYLAGQTSTRIAEDAVWEAYFNYASDTAREISSFFLDQWVSFEVAMRNAVAVARAKALELQPEDYMVGEYLAGDYNCDTTAAEWSAAPDPLAALRILDIARWAWITQHEAWFTFDMDELGAYAARIMILHRWQRLEKAVASN